MTETVKMNKLLSPVAPILLFTVWPCLSVQLRPSKKNESIFLKTIHQLQIFDAGKQKTFFVFLTLNLEA